MQNVTFLLLELPVQNIRIKQLKWNVGICSKNNYCIFMMEWSDGVGRISLGDGGWNWLSSSCGKIVTLAIQVWKWGGWQFTSIWLMTKKSKLVALSFKYLNYLSLLPSMLSDQGLFQDKCIMYVLNSSGFKKMRWCKDVFNSIKRFQDKHYYMQ